jgi:hypothetical protein
MCECGGKGTVRTTQAGEQQEFLEILRTMTVPAADRGEIMQVTRPVAVMEEQFLGDLLGRGVEATLQFLATQARMAYRYFSTQQYGCFCGKGSQCSHPKDALDQCCLTHDHGYGRHGVNTTIDMWTPRGFILSRTADLDLVTCASATRWDSHWYGPAAAAYREALVLIFSTRAKIAATLAAMPPCIRDNGKVPLWEVGRLLSTC